MSAFVGATSKLLPSAAKIVRNKRAASLHDVLFRFKNFGVGTNVYRYRWKKYWTKPDVPDCYVTITRVKVKRRGPRMNAGKAWGVMVWKGKLYHNGEERRVKAAQKRGWRWIKDMAPVAEAQKYMKISEPVHQASSESAGAAAAAQVAKAASA